MKLVSTATLLRNGTVNGVAESGRIAGRVDMKERNRRITDAADTAAERLVSKDSRAFLERAPQASGE